MSIKYRLTKPVLDDKEVKAVEKVLSSGWLAEGKVTEAFEKRVADYVGAKFAVAVSNCTIALELCLKGMRPSTEIIELTDFTHPATVQAIINVGYEPIVHDVRLDSYNWSAGNCMVEYPTMVVSWAGNPTTYPSALTFEDAACSLGSIYHNEKVGNIADATCFSFHPRKLITTGEGGMITTNDEELASTLRRMKNFGFGGGNYKFDDMRAAIGLAQMDKLEGIIAKRISMAKIYDDLLRTSQDILPPQKPDGARHTYQTYAVYLKKGNRNEIINRLAEKGIEVQRGAYALHLLPEYEQCKRIGDLHNSELLHHNLLALPMAYDITEDDQQFIIAELSQAIVQ